MCPVPTNPFGEWHRNLTSGRDSDYELEGYPSQKSEHFSPGIMNAWNVLHCIRSHKHSRKTFRISGERLHSTIITKGMGPRSRSGPGRVSLVDKDKGDTGRHRGSSDHVTRGTKGGPGRRRPRLLRRDSFVAWRSEQERGRWDPAQWSGPAPEGPSGPPPSSLRTDALWAPPRSTRFPTPTVLECAAPHFLAPRLRRAPLRSAAPPLALAGPSSFGPVRWIREMPWTNKSSPKEGVEEARTHSRPYRRDGVRDPAVPGRPMRPPPRSPRSSRGGRPPASSLRVPRPKARPGALCTRFIHKNEL